jgi:hypothetical protein
LFKYQDGVVPAMAVRTYDSPRGISLDADSIAKDRKDRDEFRLRIEEMYKVSLPARTNEGMLVIY